MNTWTCAACGKIGSEFDAECAACGGEMPALSVEPPSHPSPSLADPWIGRAAGDHVLIARIGSGGMGVVYEAEALRDRRRVAIKMLAPELLRSDDARARIAREARAAAALTSEHVVRILGSGEEDGRPYIVMELCRGEDLAARLARADRLSPRDTVTIVIEAATALDEAHAAGVIHRDLKPENVFLAREGDREITKILDFGVAKLRGPDLTVAPTTRTGALIGTPHFMSPEQVNGRPVDPRAALWSLAVLAFRCLTGRLPFDADALGALLMAITHHPLPSPSAIDPRLPRSLDAWWTKAAARTPDDRFATAGEMARALRDVFDPPGKQAPQPYFQEPACAPPSAPGGERSVLSARPPHLLLGRPMPFVGRARRGPPPRRRVAGARGRARQRDPRGALRARRPPRARDRRLPARVRAGAGGQRLRGDDRSRRARRRVRSRRRDARGAAQPPGRGARLPRRSRGRRGSRLRGDATPRRGERPWCTAAAAAARAAASRTDAAREAMDLVSPTDGIPEGEMVVRLAFAEALFAAGDTGARAAADSAQERLFARASRIGDAALRRSFLARIPENAAILGLGSGAPVRGTSPP